MEYPSFFRHAPSTSDPSSSMVMRLRNAGRHKSDQAAGGGVSFLSKTIPLAPHMYGTHQRSSGSQEGARKRASRLTRFPSQSWRRGASSSFSRIARIK